MKQPRDRAEATEKTAEGSGKAKRPYQRPAFEHERIFETTALICGKMATQGQCRFNTQNS
jgi:hypothetical protein